MEAKNIFKTVGSNDDTAIMTEKRILLIQLFSNGDCLYVTSIARQIKHNYPKSHLTWVVSTKCKSMLINNSDIDVIEEVVIPDSSQNEKVFSKILKESSEKKDAGVYTDVIVPQLLCDNMKFYDGTVWSSLVRSSGLNLTVNPLPILFLSDAEKKAAENFALTHDLQKYEHVILFECAPQTSQLLLTREIILSYSKQIIDQGNACVILSAPQAYYFNEPHIFDGNTLSIRETVALTHFCTIILGCSSGITWAATSNAAKPLSFVQILAGDTYYFNPLSITFKKWKRSLDSLIELVRFDETKIGLVFKDIFLKGFETARLEHHQNVRVQFKLHRGIIHRFLLGGKISEILTFVSVNIRENGINFSMLKFMIMGFVLFPIQFLKGKSKLY